MRKPSSKRQARLMLNLKNTERDYHQSPNPITREAMEKANQAYYASTQQSLDYPEKTVYAATLVLLLLIAFFLISCQRVQLATTPIQYTTSDERYLVNQRPDGFIEARRLLDNLPISGRWESLPKDLRESINQTYQDATVPRELATKIKYMIK